ncbi:2-oxoacid dehydrogenases acyltransferase-domain-containing protein [Geopyxis carbonaria]|nr:2-oxoacid dehydrogenases acyltransferase-domain-containing protein [Geopyxis carbonaria]
MPLMRLNRIPLWPIQRAVNHTLYRRIHSSRRLLAIKPFLLADIGEGIRECEVIQWFVEPEARVEQFDKLCEVQSDKASVDITSRYDGVIKKLHYQAGDMALVGKPLVDIDIIGDEAEKTIPDLKKEQPSAVPEQGPLSGTASAEPSNHRTLATPAVRHMCRQLGVRITEVTGTGKGGRVMKEDLSAFAEDRTSQPISTISTTQSEAEVPLTPIQHTMFKTMTHSLSIPQFLYCEEIIMNPLDRIRQNLNKSLTLSSPISRFTYIPFIIKAVSVALEDHPLLNSKLDTSGKKPRLIGRSMHNIGIAMDTPGGLLVPNIKNVGALNIHEITIELQRLKLLATEGKLSPIDLSGGTITVSNVGNIGGTVLAPVVIPTELAIVGIGRSRIVPRYDEGGQIIPKTIVDFSWSADHRVVDGATMARMSTTVKGFLEEPEKLIIRLR